MSINKQLLKFISKAFSLPAGDETANHVNFMLMSSIPIFSCLEVWVCDQRRDLKKKRGEPEGAKDHRERSRQR